MSCGVKGYLKTKEGKLMAVWDEQLQVRDVQVENKKAVTVHRWTMKDGASKFAFSFSESCFVCCKPDGPVQYIKVTGKTGISDEEKPHYLFEWKNVGNGTFRGLQSVAEPKKHLSINDEDQVILSSNSQEVVTFQLLDGNQNEMFLTNITLCNCWGK